MEIKDVLDVEFDDMDLGTITVRGYLKTLLQTLLDEGESFNGKRPFGNSGWEYHLAVPLIKSGVLKGTLDEDGYPESFDRSAYAQRVSELVDAL